MTDIAPDATGAADDSYLYESEEPSSLTDAGAVGAEGEGGEGGEPVEELEDYEDDGKKYRVPKPLVPRLMKDADYTQKTQELARQKGDFEGQTRTFRCWATWRRWSS